jgi:hypothetical protein
LAALARKLHAKMNGILLAVAAEEATSAHARRPGFPGISSMVSF